MAVDFGISANDLPGAGASMPAATAIAPAPQAATGTVHDAFAGTFEWLVLRVVSSVPASRGLSRRDTRRLQALLNDERSAAPAMAVRGLFEALGLKAGRWQLAPSTSYLPAVVMMPGQGYGFVYECDGQGAWLVETPQGRSRIGTWPEGCAFLPLELRDALPEGATARALFASVLALDGSWLWMAALASTFASFLVLATSLYSMQVYDRVMGQGGLSTLIVLTCGVVVAILVELVLKLARSAIVDRAVNRIDVESAIGVFRRMLGVRIDQFPASVGTLAAQVRGFETVRGFIIARNIYLATDLPFALFFLLVIVMIAGPLVAVVPAVAFGISLGGGLFFRNAIQDHTKREISVGNRRQGLLVEAIHCAELIKAAGAGWSLQARWNAMSRQSADETMKIKHFNDLSTHFAALVQQVSYVGLVATGAYLAVTTHSLTTGAIIACSIVSGRVLGPVAAIPGLLVQWAHSRVSLQNLEQLFALERDNHALEAPIVPAAAHGAFEIRNLEFAWPGQPHPLNIKSLKIQPGERVGVLGAIGSGKSTLLKLLAGIIKPSRGVALFDGHDIQHIAADRRAELIGYLPQASRLLGGSLRDNLTLGLAAVSDEQIVAAARLSGLANQIIGRPEGLEMLIHEGGEGLSGGQKQLVSLTRLLLAEPTAWLLDEPTASMDDATEQHCLKALRASIRPGQTLVLVTHKPQLLELVDRLIVLTTDGIVLDGPCQAVIERLRQGPQIERADGPGMVRAGAA